jgi:hypothetical protein
LCCGAAWVGGIDAWGLELGAENRWRVVLGQNISKTDLAKYLRDR